MLDPSVVAQLVGRRRAADDPLAELSGRELEVLALMAEGRSNKAIAERLFITEHTVEKRVKSIFATLRLPQSADDHAVSWPYRLPQQPVTTATAMS